MTASGPQAVRGVFARRAGYWTIAYRDQLIRVADSKGLRQIAHLLRSPSRRIHALDLVTLAEQKPTSAGSNFESTSDDLAVRMGAQGHGDELLDRAARAAYKRRIAELREELEDAKRSGDEARALKAEQEVDTLTAHLKAALGLGGRARCSGSSAERARLALNKSIGRAIEMIRTASTELGELFAATVRTGTFCCYEPSALFPVEWNFDETEDAIRLDNSLAPGVESRALAALHALTQRSVFVGRAGEILRLRELLDRANQGEGRLVTIAGGPGVGKTRLAAEFAAEASSKRTRLLVGHCYDQGDAVAYLPFVEMLEEITEREGDPNRLQALFGEQAAELARLVPRIRRVLPNLPPLPPVSDAQARRHLFNCFRDFIARLAHEGVVVVILEDLHWAQESALALLDHLVRAIADLPVLIVATCRDNDTAVDASSPFSKVLADLVRARLVERIELRGLTPTELATMVEAMSGQTPPDRFVREIYKETEGYPFFVEEVLQWLEEEGGLYDTSGKLRADLRIGETETPHNVRLVIERRLSRVDADTRQVIGAAAVIGKTFTFDLLKQATGADDEKLLDALENAEGLKLIFSNESEREAQFEFVHELIRQLMLSTLSVARRQRLHLRAADAIEQLNQDRIEECAPDLAHHLWQAGTRADPGRAIRWTSAAASQARSRSAYAEARRLLQNALALVPKLSATPQRDALELELLNSMVLMTNLIDGYATEEVRHLNLRARKLAEQTGNLRQLVEQRWSSWASLLCGADYSSAQVLADEMLDLSERESSAFSMALAYDAQMEVAFRRGDLLRCEEYFARGEAYFDSPHFIAFVAASVALAGQAAMSACEMGRAELARQRIRRQIAAIPDSAYARALGTMFLSCVEVFLREPRSCERAARETIAISEEHGLAEVASWVRPFLGWSRGQLGFLEEGIVLIKRGIEEAVGRGDRLGLGYCFTFLAELLALDGNVGDAFEAIEQALTSAPQELHFIPESLRVRGELRLKTGDAQSAEANFRESIALAKRMSARLWELRSTVSLARLLRETGRHDEACAALTEIYGWFTEGFDTADLKDAKALLDELA